MSYHSSSGSSPSSSSNSSSTTSSTSSTPTTAGTSNYVAPRNTITTSPVSSSTGVGSVYFLEGQSNSGNTAGLVGYFYPLYTDLSLINGTWHVHTFEGLDETFYMPEGETNHAVPSPPRANSYGGLSYEKYATYNVNNTVVSYTNLSTTVSQPVISVASSRRDFDPFGNNAANTESLRVEELIPEQLRASSENFVALIKDYYEHLNTEGLPTYETNRIIDEHDIDKVSSKYLDGIQGEIAKNIPDSAVMDRVSLYKKIVQYYTLKGSEESITTFFRLFFDAIIEVSYPREKLFEASAGEWVRKNDDFTQTITASTTLETLGIDYSRLLFRMVDDNNVTLGQATIRTIEQTVRYADAPKISGLSVDLDTKKNLNASNETWDSTLFKKTFRGRFMQGTRYNDLQKLIKLDGKRSYLDFGLIGNNPSIPLDTEEHTFVIRSFPKFSKENTELQQLFSLSENYSGLNSHELFFNNTTNKIGRSFVDIKEPTISIDPSDNESLIFSNFIDASTVELASLQVDPDKYARMVDFISPVGRTYNGRWKKSLVKFNGKDVYLHSTDPALRIITPDDLKYYQTDGSSFSGPDNLKIGQTIYGESLNDFSGVNAISEDGFIVAIGAAKSDDNGINSGSVRVYELSNAKVNGAADDVTTISVDNIVAASFPYVEGVSVGGLEVNMVVSGGGLPELGADDAIRITSIVSGGTTADTTAEITLSRSVTLNDNVNLRIGTNANAWIQLGQDIDGDSAGDILGSALSLNAVGNTIAIGAPRNRGADVTVDNLSYQNYLGEVKIYELNSSQVWVLKGDTFVGTNVNSKIGASVSLNGIGDRVAFGSGANPNIDYDLGTEERAGLLLQDDDIGTVYDIELTPDDITNFTHQNLLYTKDSTLENGRPRYNGVHPSDSTTSTVRWDGSVWKRLVTGAYSPPEHTIVSSDVTHPWLKLDGTVRPGWTDFLPASVALSFDSDGTTVTIQGQNFNTTSTRVKVRGIAGQYNGIFDIDTITSTTITYLRNGPLISTSNVILPDFTVEIGIPENPVGAIDGGKHIGIRIPDRISNDTEIYEWKEADAVNDPGVYSWIQVGNNIVSENNDPLTGTNVELSDDGRTAMVGTHTIDDSGIAKLCVRVYYNEEDTTAIGFDPNLPWKQIGSDYLFTPSADKADVSMSLSNDGKIFAVGIVGDGTDENFKGQVETYRLRTTVNTQEYIKFGQTIEGHGVGDECGKSVDLNKDGNIIAIGSPGNEDNGNDSGQVQVFSYNSAILTWEKVGSTIQGFGALDNAGESVSINGTGTRVSVASTGDDGAGQNRGKVEAFQIPLDVTINSFTLSEKNLDDNRLRWSIKYEDDVVYYTDWYSAEEFANLNPYGIRTKWNMANKQGDKTLPVLPHCEYIKRNNEHLFNLHNRGYLSIFYKHNGTFQPSQNITIGDTDVYDEERLWDILDYAVDGAHLILLDRTINGASRLVIFKLDQYNRYNFYQTVALNLPATHLGSADFAHVKINASQIVVGTHTFNNVDIAQIIQVYTKGVDDYWSNDHYTTLPSAVNSNVEADLLFNISENVTDSKWTSTNGLVDLKSSSIVENTSKDTGISMFLPQSTSGSGLGFDIEDHFSLSLRFKSGSLYGDTNDILTIGNITLRIAADPLNNKKTLQVVSQESGKDDYPIFLNKIATDIILNDNNMLEMFSDEYFNGEIKEEEWNNLILEFNVFENVLVGLRYSLNGFKRSKLVNLKFNSPVHGITAASRIKLYDRMAFSHIAFYDKKLSYLEFDVLERNLSINYSETVTTGINSLLDGGTFELSETGTIIIKVSTYGIHIWERKSIDSWRSWYNTAESITGGESNFITQNGSRSHSFKFFGNDLLLVTGGLNNAKQFVDQFNLSDVYNKKEHNSPAALRYLRSQYSTSASGWGVIKTIRPTVSFAQSDSTDFRVGLNYGANIAVDNDTDSFAVSLEPNSVNAPLNGPNSISNSSARSTTVKYDIWRKLANNRIQSFPVNKPAEGFPTVDSYFRRLNKSGVVKLLDKPLSYNAILSFPYIIHSTSTEDPLIEYAYDGTQNPVGYYKTANNYKPDFVISTPPGPEVYLDTKTVNINEYNIVVVKGKADRYNGYVKISHNGSDFDQGTIIEGNTLRHLSISPNSDFIIGRKDTSFFHGDISHAQYYSKAISAASLAQIITYLNNNVKKFYKIIFDDLVGTTAGATKITSAFDSKKPFEFGDLDGHTFNSFLYYDTPEYKIDTYDKDNNLVENPNTKIRVTANYGNNKAPEEIIYWGDGRLDKVNNSATLAHTYTLKYLGEYSNKKGRASSVNRLQDSDYWQKFSYVIRSGLKVTDWENSFLSLVHPAGLKFFASVILLVIRDNHWYGPKSIIFDPATRQNVNLLRVEDEFLAPFRTKTPLEDMRWLEALTAPSDSGGYHMPMFQPGWLQGDIRTREFIFEAGLWTKLARSVPGNEAAAKYTFEYYEQDQDDGDAEFRITGNILGSWETEEEVRAAAATSTTTIQIKNIAGLFNLAVGMVLEGSSIPAGTTIASITSESANTATIQASQAVSLSTDDVFTIYSNIVGSIVQQKDEDDVVIRRGIIASFAKDGDDYTGLIKIIGGFPVFIDGQMSTEDQNSADTGNLRSANIVTFPRKKKTEIVNVYGDEEQDAAYLLQDRSTTNFNSEMFLRAVLTTFKYVIPALVPQREFTKRDYEQNLKFKDHEDISSYLPLTIKDALAHRDVFMNIGATFKKINQLDTEAGAGFYIESDTSDPLNDELLIDDHITNWWNDPENSQDVSAPVVFSIDNYTQTLSSAGQIQSADIVYQDKIIDGNHIRIQGVVISHIGDSTDRMIQIAWRGAYNLTSFTELSSNPEATQLFETGTIYTLDESNNQEDIANVTLNT